MPKLHPESRLPRSLPPIALVFFANIAVIRTAYVSERRSHGQMAPETSLEIERGHGREIIFDSAHFGERKFQFTDCA